MNAIAYNIKEIEKELLVRANAKRHKLTLISNELNEETSAFSAGKEAVIITDDDKLTSTLLSFLKTQGIRRVITRSHSVSHIDMKAAEDLDIQVYNLNKNASPEESAIQIIDLLA